MEKSRKTSNVTELPVSCRSAMERMEAELSREDAEDRYKIANLPEACQEKIHEFEQELNRQGYWNICLVAYQKMI